MVNGKADKELLDYFKLRLKQGATRKELLASAVDAGWPKYDAKQILNIASPVKYHNFLFYAAVFFLLIAGVMFIFEKEVPTALNQAPLVKEPIAKLPATPTSPTAAVVADPVVEPKSSPETVGEVIKDYISEVEDIFTGGRRSGGGSGGGGGGSYSISGGAPAQFDSFGSGSGGASSSGSSVPSQTDSSIQSDDIIDQNSTQSNESNNDFGVQALPEVTVNITPTNINPTTDLSSNWNYSDTDGDVQNGSIWEWYVNGQPAWMDANLQRYYRFDGNYDDEIAGLSMSTGAGTPDYSEGIIGDSLNLDGSTEYLTFPAVDFTSTNEFTFSFWVKPHDLTTKAASWIDHRQTTYTGASNNNLFFGYHNVFDLPFTVFQTTDGIVSTVYAKESTPRNTWTHYAAVRNLTHVMVYTNGQQDASVAKTGNLGLMTSTPRIGVRNPTNDWDYDGQMDELKIYDRALSPDEIENEFNMMTYGQTQKDESMNSSQDLPRALFHFDEGSGGYVYDYFGDSTGVVNGQAFVDGMYGSTGLEFDDTTNVVANGDSTNIYGDALTIEAWIKLSATNVDQYIVTRENFVDNGGYEFYVNFQNKLMTRIYDDSSGSSSGVSTDTLSADTWYHVATTYDGSTMRLYINGALSGSGGSTIGIGSALNTDLIIGGIYWSGAYNFNGIIDELALYDRVLTQEEINQSYMRNFPHFGLDNSSVVEDDEVYVMVSPGSATSSGVEFGAPGWSDFYYVGAVEEEGGQSSDQIFFNYSTPFHGEIILGDVINFNVTASGSFDSIVVDLYRFGGEFVDSDLSFDSSFDGSFSSLEPGYYLLNASLISSGVVVRNTSTRTVYIGEGSSSDGYVSSFTRISDGLNGFSPIGLDEDDTFGGSVANLGDLNGDNVTDFAIGASRDEYSGTSTEGAVYILFMNDDQTVSSHVKITDGSAGFSPSGLIGWDEFGWDVANIGDVDGDGVVDLAVGAIGDEGDDGDTSEGAIYILFLQTNGNVKSHVKIADGLGGFGPGLLGSSDRFGGTVTGIGDLDGDGVPDIAAGAYGDDTVLNEGAAYILFLNSDGTVKSYQKIANGQGGLAGGTIGNDDRWGNSIANIGDLDNDGNEDIAVGSYWAPTATHYGYVQILFLNSDGTVKSNAKIMDGLNGFDPEELGAGDFFATSLAGIGDLNNDGIEDLLVGVYQDTDSSAVNTGAVWVLFLDTDGSVKSYSKITEGFSGLSGTTLESSDAFGYAVDVGGDINNDGIIDLVVGAKSDENGDSREGAIYLLNMGTTPVVDNEFPTVLPVSPPYPTTEERDNLVSIEALVSDNVAIDTVKANITLPSGTVLNIELFEFGPTYINDFSSTSTLGLYNLTFLVNDTAGNMNNTQTANFTIVAPNATLFNNPAGFQFTDGDGNVIDTIPENSNVQLRTSGGVPLVEFGVSDNVDLSGVIMESSDSKSLFHGFSSLFNVGASYAMYVANTNAGNGVYVCPGVTSISAIVDDCSNVVLFSGPFPQNQDVDGDSVTVTLTGGYYKVAGLTSTGIGLYDQADPLGALAAQISATGDDGTWTEPFNPDQDLAGGQNVTELNFTTNASTTRWQGYFGSVESRLMIGVDNSVFFDWTDGKSNDSIATSVYASANEDFPFDFITSADKMVADLAYEFNQSLVDSINSTMKDELTLGTITTPAANLSVHGYAVGIFDDGTTTQGIPGSPLNYSFGAPVITNKNGFMTYTVDYMLMVPVNQSQFDERNRNSLIYYFFMDLS